MKPATGDRRPAIAIRFVAIALAASLLALSLPAGAGEARLPRPNLLLIVVDTLRADHLGIYGYDRPTSPNLDRLAARGTVFTRAYSVTSFTPPAIAALLTGRWPVAHGNNARRYIPSDWTTVAQALQAAGYATAGFSGNRLLTAGRGFAAGFETYWHAPRESSGGDLEERKVRAEEVDAPALEWLRRVSGGDRPWFLYLHYMEPHYPYLPREENGRRFWRHAGVDRAAAAARFVGEIDDHFRNRKRLAWSARDTEYAVDLYDAAIADLDAAMARLLGAIDAKTLADTAIVITSDHGEEFGDHGGFQHAHALFDELIRVPLILLLPEGRLPPGRSYDIVQLTDVAPTLLDLAGAGAGESEMAGQSLLEPDARRSGTAAALLGVRFLRIHTLAFVRGSEKLIVGTEPGSVSLFDLGEDPHERRDLAAAKPERAAALRQELDRHPLLGPRNVPAPPPTAAVDPAARERLRGLGYNF